MKEKKVWKFWIWLVHRMRKSKVIVIFCNIYIYIYIWKKIMDCNPTICEKKLTTSNSNRKGGIYRETKSVDTIAFRFSWTIIKNVRGFIRVDGCIKSGKIYKNWEKLYNKKSWLFMTRKIVRLINESAFVSLKYVTWH